ncbi:MAG: hypothetical protein ACLUZQ_09385 [Butyricicoccus sp.]
MKEQYLGKHGFTLFAEEQTGGRGRSTHVRLPCRHRRNMTILPHPTLPLSHLPFVTISAAIAVVRAIEQTAGHAANQMGERIADERTQTVRHPQ